MNDFVRFVAQTVSSGVRAGGWAPPTVWYPRGGDLHSWSFPPGICKSCLTKQLHVAVLDGWPDELVLTYEASVTTKPQGKGGKIERNIEICTAPEEGELRLVLSWERRPFRSLRSSESRLFELPIRRTGDRTTADARWMELVLSEPGWGPLANLHVHSRERTLLN